MKKQIKSKLDNDLCSNAVIDVFMIMTKNLIHLMAIILLIFIAAIPFHYLPIWVSLSLIFALIFIADMFLSIYLVVVDYLVEKTFLPLISLYVVRSLSSKNKNNNSERTK